MLKQTCDICYETIKEIPCISCPYKPEGSMAMMVSIYSINKNLLLNREMFWGTGNFWRNNLPFCDVGKG